MLNFDRPARPQDFEHHVADARAEIAAIVQDPDKHLASDDFKPRWGAYKHCFADAQRGKCGYCELNIRDARRHWPSGTFSGNIDHYAPKVAYWWLAYDWDNYVYACEVCNQGCKRDRFPCATSCDVAAGPPLPPPPDVESGSGPVVRPLLLNPYESETKPADHLAYDEFGQICARESSERGRVTIEVLGLDSEPLRTMRETDAGETYRLIRRLEDAIARKDRDRMHQVLIEVANYGDSTRPFAGMVRAIFEREMDTAWSDIPWDEIIR